MKPSIIIDVRSPQEFASGHVNGALNIPHDQFQQAIDSVNGLDLSSPVIVYCRSGVRSAIACSILVQRGFRQVMNGGSMAAVLMNYTDTVSSVTAEHLAKAIRP